MTNAHIRRGRTASSRSGTTSITSSAASAITRARPSTSISAGATRAALARLRVRRRSLREPDPRRTRSTTLPSRGDAAQDSARVSTRTRASGPGAAVHELPVHELPVHELPVHDEPVHELPVHDEPSPRTARPRAARPRRTRPRRARPRRTRPRTARPRRTRPRAARPRTARPRRTRPRRTRPRTARPRRTRPRAPVHELPVHDEPVHDEPVHELPVHELPVHELDRAALGRRCDDRGRRLDGDARRAETAAAMSSTPAPTMVVGWRRPAIGGVGEQLLDRIRREVGTGRQQQRDGAGCHRSRLRRATAEEAASRRRSLPDDRCRRCCQEPAGSGCARPGAARSGLRTPSPLLAHSGTVKPVVGGLDTTDGDQGRIARRRIEPSCIRAIVPGRGDDDDAGLATPARARRQRIGVGRVPRTRCRRRRSARRCRVARRWRRPSRPRDHLCWASPRRRDLRP